MSIGMSNLMLYPLNDLPTFDFFIISAFLALISLFLIKILHEIGKR